VEIDERRHRQALANFEAAGLSAFIDARLGNAHEIVPALEGPFDFVFSDADKDWYPNYFKAVFPKLEVGGCYTTHNISERGVAAAPPARASTWRCCAHAGRRDHGGRTRRGHGRSRSSGPGRA
jgi:predicted O-methyltransferase YrrM